jgi:putative ABC transport system ATP-binding protein
MDRHLFRYIWEHSKRDQIIILAVVLVSLPFYFASLDLPRRIVNEAIQGRAFENGQETARFLDVTLKFPELLGGHKLQLFEGFAVGRLTLLYGLSLLFLFFVLVNGWFKYYINVAKGALGERMLRRLRFQLFSMALRFRPEALRTVKSSEAATIIKDEVEPIGGFIGDAFIQPLFLGTQAATALLFILMQNMWLGMIAAGIVAAQFIIIPRMRRELLRLGRMRQIASRRLAGRIGEVIDGIEAVHVHNTGRWERAEIGSRLYELFDIRFRIFKRKFIVKFLNNLLAQLTPFFFYAVGGYFALRGQLDIGQLVAVIAAYRELPPPLKELIDWDQQRLDVQVKYDQVVGYFAAEKLLPQDEAPGHDTLDEPLVGTATIADLKVYDLNGTPVIDGLDLSFELPNRIGIVSDGGPAAGFLARILARRTDEYQGRITIGRRELAGLSADVVAGHIAYSGPEPILFPGSLRDNLLYGLRTGPRGEPELDEVERRRLAEAHWTGNPVDPIEVGWVDSARAGSDDEVALDRTLIDLLKQTGFEEDIYRFGLSGQVEPEHYPELAARLVEARERFREKLIEGGMEDFVEPFDPECYNTRSTIAENLLFGVPTNRKLTGRDLAEHQGFRQALDRARLTEDLIRMGMQIAETMTEIFRGLPSNHPLFEQFSFVHADELDEVEAIVKRQRMRGGPSRDDRARLLALPLAYIEPRHRLGLLDDEMRTHLLEGRRAVHEMLAAQEKPGVDFYDPKKLCEAAPVRDNLLFGRVNETMADARERVRLCGAAVVDEFNLRGAIERVGLDHQVGPAGRLLTPPQRASVNLIRNLVKRPDILVVDGSLSTFGESRTDSLLRLIMEAMDNRTLIVVLPTDRRADLFDVVIRFKDGTATLEAPPAGRSGAAAAPPDDTAERPSDEAGDEVDKVARQAAE